MIIVLHAMTVLLEYLSMKCFLVKSGSNVYCMIMVRGVDACLVSGLRLVWEKRAHACVCSHTHMSNQTNSKLQIHSMNEGCLSFSFM